MCEWKCGIIMLLLFNENYSFPWYIYYIIVQFILSHTRQGTAIQEANFVRFFSIFCLKTNLKLVLQFTDYEKRLKFFLFIYYIWASVRPNESAQFIMKSAKILASECLGMVLGARMSGYIAYVLSCVWFTRT